MSTVCHTTLQDRITKASEVMKITEEQLWQYLSKIGICKDDADALSLLEAETTREGDARNSFCDTYNTSKGEVPVPVVRFLAGWAILKGKAKGAESNKEVSSNAELIACLRPIAQYSDTELLEKYDIDASSEIIDELDRRSQSRPFIVYDVNKENIDIENTLRMLKVARRKETKQKHVLPNGKPVLLYCAGQFPMLFVEESPIHPGVILTDGYCDECGQNWSGISLEDRIIVRVAVMAEAIETTKASINKLINQIRIGDGDHVSPGTESLLDIPDVKFLYDELKENGQLPVLRKRASSSQDGSHRDPCFVR